jgi:peroxiredoxin
MSKRQQQDWYKQWHETPEADAFYDTMWHDPGRRQYVFHIENDGLFRIDDVIAGKYKFTVWIEEQFRGGGGRPEEIASYYGALDVPQMPGGRSDEPLDLGELVLTMHDEPLRVGDTAPLFEAKTLDGDDLKLIDYRGKYVLLSFWQPVFHPEIEQLRQFYDAHHPGGRLEIIGLGGHDTLEEVKKYVEEKEILWPQIFTGEDSKSGIAKDYALGGTPWIFLVDPDGKIVAKNLRGEKLKAAVLEALGSEPEVPEQAVTGDNLFEMARSSNYKVGPEWFRAAESTDNRLYMGVERHAEAGGEPRFNEILDDWVRWKYDLDKVVDMDSAMALFETFCAQFDQQQQFHSQDPRARAIKLICDKLNTSELIERYVTALDSGRSFSSSYGIRDAALSIEDPIITGHERAGVLPASASVVWYALRRIDENLDRQYPASRNIIEDTLTPIFIRRYEKQDDLRRLDPAVLLGGPAIANFLLRKDWRDEQTSENLESARGIGGLVNKWLLRLINLDDPAGEKFRAEHREIVLRFADAWAARMRLTEFEPPRFLLLDRHKGTDSLAWQYWPRFSANIDRASLLTPGIRLKWKFEYLKMLEPFTTTQMYFDAWVHALDELEGGSIYAHDLMQRHVPENRKLPLATMLLEEVNERLKRLGPPTSENLELWSWLDMQRRACNGVLNKQ